MSDVGGHFGPIDCFVVTFPTGAPTPGGFSRLARLVDEGHIRILDVEFVSNAGGTIERVDAAVLGDAVATFVGASSGLVDEADLSVLAIELAEGAVAAIVVYEELSVLGVFETFEGEGAEIVLEGHLSPVELAAALDASDAA